MSRLVIGFVILAVGITIIGIGAGITLPGASGSGQPVCDLVGTMTGKAQDFNVGKNVVDINLNMNPSKCRDPTFLDGFEGMLSIAPPTAALLSNGEVEISVILFDSAQEQVRAHKFKVTTGFGEVEKSFSEDIKFKAIEHGTYKAKIYTSWAGSQPVKEFTFTV